VIFGGEGVELQPSEAIAVMEGGSVDLWMGQPCSFCGRYLFSLMVNLAETSPVKGRVGRQWACVMACINCTN
jgi:hypothetical protein